MVVGLSTNLPIYEPMLATRWPHAFSDPEWAFEVKWDGVRAVAAWDGQRLEVRSRAGRPVLARYPELDRLAGFAPCILDGEIVAFDDEGRPSFGRLQQRQSRRTPISFMAFDLLFLGRPRVDEPWASRREKLALLDLPAPYVVPEAVIGEGDALWAGVVEQGLEGMVGKRLDSPYRPGRRSADWRKVARVDQVRAVVGGFLPGSGSRAATFGSLLLGLVDADRLRYIGSVGTGFTGESLLAIHSALNELAADHSPFQPQSEVPAQSRFVEPTLVALVEFKEWTRAGKLRAPSFKGFTDDAWETITWTAEGPPTPQMGFS